MESPEIIRRRRIELNLSQADVAKAVGVDQRHIRRYETGEAQPTLQVARALARTLRITLDELAGGPPALSGRWWSAWDGLGGQTLVGPVDVTHTGERAVIVTTTADPAHPADVFAWHGECHVGGDADSLIGWFIVDHPEHRTRGTLNLDRSGNTITGDWIRMSLSAGLATGPLVLVRDHAALADAIKHRSDRR